MFNWIKELVEKVKYNYICFMIKREIRKIYKECGLTGEITVLTHTYDEYKALLEKESTIDNKTRTLH